LLEEKKRLEQEFAQLQYELPHLYKFKWYAWAKAFYESRHKINLLCAANQISKSTTLQRKDVEWITNKNLWPELWDIPLVGEPRQFWYLYPSAPVATAEVHQKWIPDVMPKRGKVSLQRYKEKCEDTTYGWEIGYVRKFVHCIEWASGITQYFKFYSQDVHSLQSGTVHKVSCDEELPEELFDELMLRISATDGYFDKVFTATRNQLFWHLAMEARGTEREKLKEAFKQTVSKYDCQVYADGSPGKFFDLGRIKRDEARCKSQAEIDRRINGRFVADEGRKYASFEPTRHMVTPFEVPKDWLLFGGVDPGSGGKNHPAGMGILAVKPDYTAGYVIDGWRGDGVETTAGDCLNKFIELRGKRKLVWSTYDHAVRDFYTIAIRSGETFIKAEKSHDIGEGIVNTLFKNDMLFIFDLPQLQSLASEFMTLMAKTNKRAAQDDFIDGAVRYPCALIPWDFSHIQTKEINANKIAKPPMTEQDYVEQELNERRDAFTGDDRKKGDGSWKELDAEIEYWNEMY